jgi:hypothetical protein
MKLSELSEQVDSELQIEKIEYAKTLIKESLKQVKSAEKTLKEATKAHEELLNTDVEDLEDDDFVY